VRFDETPLAGAFLITAEPHLDERGSFGRFFCVEEYERHGLVPRIAQGSLSHNRARGTLRGLHYQAAPHLEAKTVRCLRGSIYDVIVDLRPGSATRGRWHAAELAAESGQALYAPPGFAHGFLTLESDTLVEYLISELYVAAGSRGVRYDDPLLAIHWPFPPQVVSDRDRHLPYLDEDER
jgi:dTDP-4-dehydrorhamnose 3,5-epimerase